ncbi:GspE/PulE family protein, partial [Chloroflexota bacterium]
MAEQQEIPENLQPKLRMNDIKPGALRLVPEAVARKYNIVPLEVRGNVLRLAMANPNDIIAIDSLSAATQMHIDPVAFSANEIKESIEFYYQSHEEIERQVSQIKSPSVKDGERTIVIEEADSPIIRALSLILDEAVRTGASDIHFQPQEHELLVRYRVDGALHDVITLPLHAAPILTSRIKIMANLNIADHLRPQDGQFAIQREKSKDKIDVRVGIIPSAYGETATLRLLDTSKVLLDITQLGFLPESLAQYRDMLQVPHGMILVSGPTGAGKTTTLYASVNSLDCRQR